MAGEFVIGNMVAKLAADTSDFIKDMSGASNVAKDFKKSSGAVDEGAKKIQGSFGAIKNVVKDFLIGGGLIIAGQQVVNFVKDMVTSTVDYGLAVDSLANITQTSYEETSKLIQIADDARISQDQLKMAMKEMVDGGVQPTIDNLAKLADEYGAIRDPVERANFLMETFGKRAGPEMGRLLAMGADGIREAADQAERFGLVLGEEGVEAAKDYYAAMDDLGDAWEGFKMGMGQSVLPGISDFLEGMNEVNEVMEGGIQAYIEWYQVQAVYGRMLGNLGMTEEEYADSIQGTTAVEQIRAGVYESVIPQVEELADATDGVTEANKAAEQSTRDWMAELDTGIDNTIKNWLDEMEFMAGGGGQIQDAANAVKQALLDGKITPAEATEYWNELYVAAEVLKVQMGEITADQAAKNIRDTLNVSLTEAKQLIKEVKEEGTFHITSTITVKVKWQGNLSASDIGNRASGGDMGANEISWVGEKGPELFVAPTAGTIVPNHQVGKYLGEDGGGGGDTYNEITIINNDRLAAAQTMATLQNSRLQRLSASMG